ncbi:hypothetical protein PW52_04765 [Tamlana sedimentorum]|uniref:histidine kinase n=1 Tax=Neotamlana sedimentorum TaxID=1435349 RepID=A0A0D7WBB6_9FLAO|nr:tetratricopeptide repeat-containing sensor histidine kinase [Tamlana sedimentorum]KJD36470.1 hypothetical protein PW52_04765 [Tamlana sedimentorum]
MNPHLYLLFILLNVVISFGQNQKTKQNLLTVEGLIKQGDSLKKINKDDALKIFNKALAISLDNNLLEQASILFKKSGVIYHTKHEYIMAEYLYKKGIALDSLSITSADLLYNISLIKSIKNQQDSALFYLENSISKYEKFKLNEAAFKAFLRAGILYKDRQIYEQALNYSIKAYKGFDSINNKQKLADACTVIGSVQNHLKNYNQSLQYHFEALELNSIANNNYGKAVCYTNIGNVYSNLKETDSTVLNYEKALALFKPTAPQYAVLLNNLGSAYFSLNDFNASKNYYLEAIKLNENLKDTISLMYSFNGITSLYLEHNNLKKANEYLNKSSKILSTIIDKNLELGYYRNKANYYEKTKNYQKAIQSQKHYNVLYEKIYNLETAKITQKLQAQFDYNKKENEILRLKLKDNENQYLLKEKTKNIREKNLTLIVLAVILLLLVVVYYLFLQRQKTITQKIKIEKLEAIYKGQESIKKRISRDLHDIITTNFDGLRLRVLALKRSDKISEKVDEIATDLKKMNNQIRTVSHRLYPLEMYMGKQKFNDVIMSRLTEFQLYGKVFVELENELPELLNKQSLTVQNNFYGIFLEVLNNIEKHAVATKLTIKNSVDNINNLHFIFEDNGIGITKDHKEGIGLLNIRQRAEILEGTCSITNIQIGTRVHIYFPISKNG